MPIKISFLGIPEGVNSNEKRKKEGEITYFTLLDLQKIHIAVPLAKKPTTPVRVAHTPIMFSRVGGGFIVAVVVRW